MQQHPQGSAGSCLPTGCRHCSHCAPLPPVHAGGRARGSSTSLAFPGLQHRGRAVCGMQIKLFFTPMEVNTRHACVPVSLWTCNK